MPDPTDHFAAEVRGFREWVLSGTDTGPAAAREALVRITRLYLAGLALPPEWCREGDDAGAEDEQVDRAEADDAPQPSPAATASAANPDWTIYNALVARLPLQHYAEVFDPLPDPPEAPIIGDLADDIHDILKDVQRGLMFYDAGRREEAVWDWGFHLVHHWGEHATSAIRALHCWLARHAPALLSAPS